MVDVFVKVEIVCEVWVEVFVIMCSEMLVMIIDGCYYKGDVFVIVCIVGIQVVKCIWDLILFCYLLMFSKVEVNLQVELEYNWVCIEILCCLIGKIGVEMEVLIVVFVVVLIIYDMCKVV